MSSYLPLIKQWHIAFALLSLSGFFLRGVLMLRRSAWLQHGLVRRLPHVIDSALFLLGLTLLWLGPWSLAHTPWLQAKLLALLLYIGLGFVALHRGRFSHRTRIIAWCAALLVFAYMLAVAFSKQPWFG
jgi:uncharacterized membrane protein SirB2